MLAKQRQSPVLVVAGLLIATFLVALVATTPKAQAAEGWTNYCYGQTVESKYGPLSGICGGAKRWVNGLMGEGDAHSVCVMDTEDWIQMCTTGPGAWVYNPGDSKWAWAEPLIRNNAVTPTVVHAVAWTSN